VGACLVLRAGSGEFDAGIELGRERLEAGVFLAVTDEDAAQLATCRAKLGDGADHVVEALLLDEPADTEQRRLLLLLADRRVERLQIDPVVEDHHLVAGGGREVLDDVSLVGLADRHGECRAVDEPLEPRGFDAVPVDVLRVAREAVGKPCDRRRDLRDLRSDRREVCVEVGDPAALGFGSDFDAAAQDRPDVLPAFGEQGEEILGKLVLDGAQRVDVAPEPVEELRSLLLAEVDDVASHVGEAPMEPGVVRPHQRQDCHLDALALELEDLVEDERLRQARELLEDVADVHLGFCGHRCPAWVV
jgi:hypothetical protein